MPSSQRFEQLVGQDGEGGGNGRVITGRLLGKDR